MVKPIYIFSLPRSGSTLLQRILTSNKEISSVAEPWILLPFVYPLKKSGVYAEYSHEMMYLAINDFIEELPNGRQDYLDAIGSSTLKLYEQLSNKESSYFLDKTPRYATIAEDIIDMFPDGKFIVLFRNPISIISSIIETWGNGKWNVFRFNIDLFDGLQHIINITDKYKNKILIVQYENLLNDPTTELMRISTYLNLDINIHALENFSKIQFSGQMGDPTGAKVYKLIEPKAIDKWKATIHTSFRKYWCRQYLSWINHDRLEKMGYNLQNITSDINSIKTNNSKLLSDIVRHTYGLFYNKINGYIFKSKIK